MSVVPGQENGIHHSLLLRLCKKNRWSGQPSLSYCKYVKPKEGRKSARWGLWSLWWGPCMRTGACMLWQLEEVFLCCNSITAGGCGSCLSGRSPGSISVMELQQRQVGWMGRNKKLWDKQGLEHNLKFRMLLGLPLTSPAALVLPLQRLKFCGQPQIEHQGCPWVRVCAQIISC